MDDLDWDDDDYEPPALNTELEKEEEEEEEEEVAVEKKPAAKTSTKKKSAEAKQEQYVDETLDDPLEEKLRQQRLVEAADFEAAQELFGGAGLDLETFIPKSEKEFIQYGEAVVGKYLRPVMGSAFYSEMLKTMIKKGTSSMSAAEVKDIESCVVVVRNEKVKAEKPATKGKKASKKAQLNSSAGGDLDDINFYQEKAMDDDYDFM